MATKLDVLQVGYADQPKPLQMRASGSCCLVRSGKSKIIFDTMGPWEKDKLLDALAKHKIHPDDIEYLICSHSHPDHIGNNNLFSKAKMHFVGMSVYEHDIYDLSCFEPMGSHTYKTVRDEEIVVITYKNYNIDAHLTIEPTPGHTLECISLFLDNCDSFGSVALTGDLFEREADITDEGIWLSAGSQNSNLQRAHRARVYNHVDYIVPGHGSMFKTNQPKPIKF